MFRQHSCATLAVSSKQFVHNRVLDINSKSESTRKLLTLLTILQILVAEVAMLKVWPMIGAIGPSWLANHEEWSEQK